MTESTLDVTAAASGLAAKARTDDANCEPFCSSRTHLLSGAEELKNAFQLAVICEPAPARLLPAEEPALGGTAGLTRRWAAPTMARPRMIPARTAGSAKNSSRPTRRRRAAGQAQEAGRSVIPISRSTMERAAARTAGRRRHRVGGQARPVRGSGRRLDGDSGPPVALHRHRALSLVAERVQDRRAASTPRRGALRRYRAARPAASMSAPVIAARVALASLVVRGSQISPAVNPVATHRPTQKGQVTSSPTVFLAPVPRHARRDLPLLVHQQRGVVGPHLLGEQVGHLRRPEADAPGRGDCLPKDIPRLPRSWIEDTYSNLIHYGEAPASVMSASACAGVPRPAAPGRSGRRPRQTAVRTRLAGPAPGRRSSR